MEKSADAFRTISEVAEVLETPAHVLRFWESRFPQIRPVKRAGGRRYYRPADIALLAGIKRLLHDEGMTIRGVQKILREQGVRHVAGLGGDARGIDLGPQIDEAEADQAGFAYVAEPEAPRRGKVVAFAPVASVAEAIAAEEPAKADPAPLEAAAAVAEPPEASAEEFADPEPTLDPAGDTLAPDAAETQLVEEGPVELPDLVGEPEELATSADESEEPAVEPEALAFETEDGGEPADDPTSVAKEESAAPAAPPAAPAPAPVDSAAGFDPDSLPEEPGFWLPAALRSLPPGALRDRQAALMPLQARLLELRERLASAHRGGRR